MEQPQKTDLRHEKNDPTIKHKMQKADNVNNLSLTHKCLSLADRTRGTLSLKAGYTPWTNLDESGRDIKFALDRSNQWLYFQPWAKVATLAIFLDN